MATALEVLKSEHQNMLKVMTVLESEVERFAAGGDLDLELFLDIVDYVKSFPDEVHHPKEEHLFRPLLARRPEATPLIEGLRHEHQALAARLAEIEVAAERLAVEEAQDKTAFAALVREYVRLLYEHMRKEEMEAFPLAREALTPADWEVVDAEVARGEDPFLGEEGSARYREILRRIVYLAEAEREADRA